MKACCKTKNENGGKVHRVPCGSVACSSSTARKPDLSKPVRGTRAPHTSAQAVHMLKTAEKSTALEDLWSINPSGALRNPACRVPNLQELSFQWLPQTGHRSSPCGGAISEKRDILDRTSGQLTTTASQVECRSSRKTDRIVVPSITHNTTSQKRGACVCVQDSATGLWRIPIESSILPA